MKKANLILSILLIILVAGGLYVRYGTGMRVDAVSTKTPEGTRCDMTVTNRSLIPCQYLEFLPVDPADLELTGVTGAGSDIGILKSLQVAFVIPEGTKLPCTVQMGYYVLGMRRYVNVTVE